MTPDRDDNPTTAQLRALSTQDAADSAEVSLRPPTDAEVPTTQPAHATAVTVPAAKAAPHATDVNALAGDTASKFPVAPILHHARQRYQIVAEHGHGGLGRVSRAHDRDLGRDVAIKELITRNELAEARFLREALITARLEHPGIVPVHEAGRWPDGTPFYAMKLVAGRPLRDLIGERKTVDERIGLLHHVIAVADAIAYAHGRNIIHRDLKPANVIVGDFGETVVIDWGLAKDLSAREIPADDAASPNTHTRIATWFTKPAFRPTHTAVGSSSLKDLTTTGSVLGTPAYMPPEQERGEHVDQRADVFAIGAMLWELCSLQKVPPMEPRLRYRILSKAGIDRDLISILNKALQPDPARRYFDAGELATDLKAFKAGTHISSRAHSLAARVDRWQRRHRKTAAVSLLVVATFFATLVYYVFNIHEARDRADAALRQSERATSALASERDTLVLRNAELLLVRDPTATINELSRYRGRDANRAKQLRAEATALGTSSFQAKPHTANVWWAHKMADGSILSFSKDGTLKHTAPNGDSRTLAANGSGQTLVRFALARGLLLYACKPAALCIFDIHEIEVSPREICTRAAISASFSPNGTQLVYITSTGDIYLVDIADLSSTRTRWILRQADASDVLFLDETHIGLGAKDSNFVVAIDDLSTVHKMWAPQGTLWSADAEHKIIAQAFSDGTIALFDFEGTQRLRKSLCMGHITAFVFVPLRGHIVFGCEDGIVGTWTATNVAPRTLARVAASVDSIILAQGYAVAATSNGSIAVIAHDTGAITSLQGHLGRISSLERVDGVHFELLTGDNQGSIRLWRPDLIPLSAWADTDEPHTAYGFGLGESELLATTPWGVVYKFDARVPSRPTMRLNMKGNDRLAVSPDGDYFATYGNSAVLELWRFSPLMLVATKDTRQSALHTVTFLEDNSLLTLGQDGSLRVWTPNLQLSWQNDLAEHIVAIAASPQGNVVAATVTGQLWHLSRISSRKLLTDDVRVVSLFFDKAAKQFLAVYSTGKVYRIDTYGNTIAWVTTIPGEVRQARASSHAISVETMDGHLYVLRARDPAWSSFDERSLPLSSAIKDFAMTEDGMIVLLGADKRIWIYSISLNDWYCIIGAPYDFRLVAFSRNQHIAAISDNMGHAYRLDLNDISRRMYAPL